MSYFDDKNWTRVDTEDGDVLVRVYEGVYVGPEVDAAETYRLRDEVWTKDGEEVEDVERLDDLNDLIAPHDLAHEADGTDPVPLSTEPLLSGE